MFSKKVFEGGGLLSQVVQICFVGPALCTNQELSDCTHVCSVSCIHVQFSNHCFKFAYPCSGFGNTKPSNKSRLNKWYRINISVPLIPHDGWGHCTCWPRHYYMRWCGDHTWGLMTMWSPDDMPWPCQLSELLQEAQWTNKQMSRVQIMSQRIREAVGNQESGPTLHSTAST